MKNEKPIDITFVETCVAKIRFKVWDVLRSRYAGSAVQEWEWWTAARAEKYARDQKLRQYEIHMTRTTLVTQPVQVVKRSKKCPA